jgi:hypothetical protein
MGRMMLAARTTARNRSCSFTSRFSSFLQSWIRKPDALKRAVRRAPALLALEGREAPQLLAPWAIGAAGAMAVATQAWASTTSAPATSFVDVTADGGISDRLPGGERPGVAGMAYAGGGAPGRIAIQRRSGIW